MKRRAHFFIHGRVQGVGYRMYAVDEATRLDLTGWVRNLPGGDVEVLAEGEEKDIVQFLSWCREGHPYAKVTRIDEEYSPATDEFYEFTVSH